MTHDLYVEGFNRGIEDRRNSSSQLPAEGNILLVEDSTFVDLDFQAIVFAGPSPAMRLNQLHLKNCIVSGNATVEAILLGKDVALKEFKLENVTMTNIASHIVELESSGVENIIVTDSTFDSIGGLRLRDYFQKMRP